MGIRIAVAVLAAIVAGRAGDAWAESPPPVKASNGMVVTAQRLASEVGADVLRSGGNAVDAAVSVGYALAVVHPCCGNIGGGGFATIRLADGTETFLNFRETAPVAATPEMFLDPAGEPVPGLSTVGYKILLDLVASHPRPLKVAEVGYTFGTRQHGESKLDDMVALEYLELLLDKAVGRFVPVKLIQFGAIGVLGVGVHLAILYAALMAGIMFATAQATAVIGAMTFNFALNNRFTYRDQQLKGAFGPSFTPLDRSGDVFSWDPI